MLKVIINTVIDLKLKALAKVYSVIKHDYTMNELNIYLFDKNYVYKNEQDFMKKIITRESNSPVNSGRDPLLYVNYLNHLYNKIIYSDTAYAEYTEPQISSAQISSAQVGPIGPIGFKERQNMTIVKNKQTKKYQFIEELHKNSIYDSLNKPKILNTYMNIRNNKNKSVPLYLFITYLCSDLKLNYLLQKFPTYFTEVVHTTNNKQLNLDIHYVDSKIINIVDTFFTENKNEYKNEYIKFINCKSLKIIIKNSAHNVYKNTANALNEDSIQNQIMSVNQILKKWSVILKQAGVSKKDSSTSNIVAYVENVYTYY